MSEKIFSEDGSRLRTFNTEPHKWVLKDGKEKVYFEGNAEQLNAHLQLMFDQEKYIHTSRRGRKKTLAD